VLIVLLPPKKGKAGKRTSNTNLFVGFKAVSKTWDVMDGPEVSKETTTSAAELNTGIKCCFRKMI
jgi:hypothetical protein